MFQDIFRNRAGSKGVFLGSPESEAEASENSRMPLSETYFDFHGIAGQMAGEKFIISGRKGSGKSAFAEFVVIESASNPNLFAKFIRKHEFSLEKLSQLSDRDGNDLDTPALLRWLVYVHILKLFLQSEAAQADQKFELLRQFLKKNSGFVDINALEIKEVVKTRGFSISIEYLKRFLRTRFNLDTNIREERAPFYRLLPHLEEVIIRVLGSPLEMNNKNSYFIFFDDLDLDYTPDNVKAKQLVIDILRAAKELNNEVFGRRGLGAKVIVLLRDDIEMQIANEFADAAKIVSSYAVKLSWYQDGYLQHLDEENLYLKQFINRRIERAFSSAGLDVNTASPWDSLVRFEPKSKTTFKDVVNFGLFRPRDLLLYFLPMQNGFVSVPISWGANSSLATSYASELARELKNEMRAFYTSDRVEMIFRALARINRRNECSFDDARQDLQAELSGADPDEALYYLFDRSLIGTRNRSNNWLTFNCRSHDDARVRMHMSDQDVVVQYGVREYLSHSY